MFPLAFLAYQQFYARPKAAKAQEFGTLMSRLLFHVRAEENAAPSPPGSLTAAFGSDPEETRLLKEGAAAFARGDYPAARESFAGLAALKPSREATALLAAANLRESNFSLAREHYLQIVSPPFNDQDLAESVSLGLALALFNLVEYDEALRHAEAPYRSRLDRLGPGNPETVSAGNILAGILIGLSRGPEAE
ncbi:MAG: hypothetical protein LBW85_05620, partial [Deltaproteobacteria bacterium]|nr:hypothetical protein [Deltaproteobacteria bacterium]